jgi:hypothetical protein
VIAKRDLDAFQFEWDQSEMALRRGDPESANAHLRRSCQHCPEVWVGLAGQDKEDKRYSAAIEKLELALEFATRHKTRAQIYNNLGMLLDRTGQRAPAERCFDAGLAIDKRDANLLVNKALARLWSNDVAGSLKWFESATRTAPASGHVSFNHAIALLLAGDYLRGWSLYENRFKSESSDLKKMQLPVPEWRNQPLAGKRILIAAEQGAGDTLMMMRYIPSMIEQGATVTLAVQKGIKALIQDRWPDLEVVEEQDQVSTLHDYWSHMMSLPWITRTTLESIPPAVWLEPWFHPFNDKLKIGICWAGSLSHANDLYRSTNCSMWNMLTDVPGCEFYSLQVGEHAQEFQLIEGVKDLTHEIRSFKDSADALRELDLVITVDTSVAHLAGSMGMPCWVLLPFAPDFRWLLNRSDSPWYPSLRLFRQPVERDWQSVFTEVREALLSEHTNPVTAQALQCEGV